ncbi:MAG TPA: lytic transglycosylase domain-containing protein [Ferruginibacter sp.]|nr:lytic transglycosylase domain-containing protein [Ferruginibacter sp.]HRE63575.1 lytic transglycosylase domain-containing protein [Ferruginibacter sp.]
MIKPAMFCCILFCIGFTCSSIAFSDTAKNKLNTSTNKEDALPKKNTIVFPELLEADAQNALAYMEKFSANRRAYLMRMHTKGKRFFPKVNSILNKYNVPTEFAVLLALESAFNANAVSKAGAVGYWQIMDDVAKEYGLRIVEDQHKLKTKSATKTIAKSTPKKVVQKKKPAIDDRKNFVKSTHTAAKYLKARMKNLDNNWLLIAASYNWGVGNVWNAIASSKKKNATYWDIEHKLPSETKAYVMNFITLNVIFKNYDQFVKGTLDFKAAQTAGLSKAEKNTSVAAL